MPKPSHFTVLMLKASLTEWDEQGRLCGVTDSPAAEESMDGMIAGVRESDDFKRLRERMSLILCGPSDVSMGCAEVLAGTEFGDGDVKIKVIEELSEVNLGLWEGVLRSDLEDRFPSVYTQWIEQPGTVSPPDGESLDAVQERVLGRLFRSLLKIRAEAPVVGLVLRPYAWAVVKCWLDEKPLSEVWGYLEAGGALESFSLDREVVEGYCTQKSKIA